MWRPSGKPTSPSPRRSTGPRRRPSGRKLPFDDPASVVAYRQRRLDRDPQPRIGEAVEAELWPPDVVPRSLPKPAPTKPKSIAKPKSAAKPKSVAKPKTVAHTRPAAAPDAPDPYATLGAPPADAAGQEPAAPGGEEEL